MKIDYKEEETGHKSIMKSVSYPKHDFDDGNTQKQDYFSNLMTNQEIPKKQELSSLKEVSEGPLKMPQTGRFWLYPEQKAPSDVKL